MKREDIYCKVLLLSLGIVLAPHSPVTIKAATNFNFATVTVRGYVTFSEQRKSNQVKNGKNKKCCLLN